MRPCKYQLHYILKYTLSPELFWQMATLSTIRPALVCLETCVIGYAKHYSIFTCSVKSLNSNYALFSFLVIHYHVCVKHPITSEIISYLISCSFFTKLETYKHGMFLLLQLPKWTVWFSLRAHDSHTTFNSVNFTAGLHLLCYLTFRNFDNSHKYIWNT